MPNASSKDATVQQSVLGEDVFAMSRGWNEEELATSEEEDRLEQIITQRMVLSKNFKCNRCHLLRPAYNL